MPNETVTSAEDGGHDEMLRQLDVLYERTTQGSWRTYQNGVHPVEVGGMGSGDDYAICTHGPKSFANADWIATMHDEWLGIRARLGALSSENERLREALEPFAKAGELFPDEDADFDQWIYRPAAGDEYALSSNHLRAARRALEGGE